MTTNSTRRKVQIEEEEQKMVYYKPAFFKNKHPRRSLYPTSFNPNYQTYDLKERSNMLKDVQFEGSAYFIESSANWMSLPSSYESNSTSKLKSQRSYFSNTNNELQSSSFLIKHSKDSDRRHVKLPKTVTFNGQDASIENFIRLEPMRCMYCIGKPNFSRFWRDLKEIEKDTTLINKHPEQTSRNKYDSKSKFNDTTYI
jgi:hypothetical protein